MKAIKYQGRLWIKADKAHTIEHPVFDVDAVVEQCKAQADQEKERLQQALKEGN